MKKILLITFMILSIQSWASHLSGGWIETEVINSTTIKVRLKLIRDCSGIPLPSTESLTIENLLNGQVVIANAPIPLLSSSFIDNYCANSNSTCNGGVLPGYELKIYESFFTLPSGLNNIRIHYTSCCRPSNVVNISGMGSASYGIYTDIFGLNTMQNNSPTKNSYDIIAINNSTNVISYSFTDLESDSLAYQLAAPLESIISNVPVLTQYNLGFGFANPLGNGLLSSLNINDGNYTFATSSNVGAYAMAFDLNEYRSGQAICKMHGEQVILVQPSTNTNILNLNANVPSSKIFNVCKNDTISYLVNFNANDSIDVTVDSLNFYAGATFNVTNVNATQKLATFIWQAPSNAISLKQDKIVFHVTKYACPYKKQLTYTTIYNVNSCPADSVWPGDINLDKTVNLIDGIYLAAAYNDNGTPRVNPSNNWVPQYAINWTNNFMSGANHKHSDCDGNGTVDALDAVAIAQNFNLVHNKNGGNTFHTKVASTIYDPVVTFGTPLNTSSNTIVNIPMFLGDQIKKALGANAILFKIDADPLVVDGSSMLFTPLFGLLNNLNNVVVTQYKDINNADLYVAFVMKNNASFSGFGKIGQFDFNVRPEATVSSTSIAISQQELFGPNMYPQPITSSSSTNVNVVSGLKQTVLRGERIELTPNPFQNNFTVSYGKTIKSYEILDLTGKVVLSKTTNASTFNVNTDKLNAGIYFIKLNIDDKWMTKKLIKE
jgi:Secretion system C-terminal sorting domain